MDLIRGLKRAVRSTREYQDAVERMLRAGSPAESRWHDAHIIASRLDMTPGEREKAHVRVLEALMARSTADGYLDEDELKLLDRALSELQIDPARLDPAARERFARLFTLQRIAHGALPTLDSADVPLPLGGGETAHLVTHVRTVEERVSRRRFSSGHSGFSFRIAKGVSYRIGGSRGVSVPVTSTVVTSTGPLTLTSERAVYLGSKKGFAKPWGKVVAVEPFSDALRFHFSDRQTPTTLLYDDARVAPIAEALCARLLRP